MINNFGNLRLQGESLGKLTYVNRDKVGAKGDIDVVVLNYNARMSIIWDFLTQPVTVCTTKWYSLARELAERPSFCKATIEDLNSVEYRLAFII